MDSLNQFYENHVLKIYYVLVIGSLFGGPILINKAIIIEEDKESTKEEDKKARIMKYTGIVALVVFVGPVLLSGLGRNNGPRPFRGIPRS